MTRSEIDPIVLREVAECLALDEDEVSIGSSLVDDLGADSLDFIDLLFNLEQVFDIEVRDAQRELLKLLNVTDPDAVDEEGYLKADRVESLEPWLPALKTYEAPIRLTPGEVFSLISVETLCLLVAHRLA